MGRKEALSFLFQRATAIATSMVKYWGMSEKVGPRTVGKEVDPSEAELVHTEIRKLLQESYERAKKILLQHPNELQALAEALMKYDTLDADAVKVVIAKAGEKGPKKVAGNNCKASVSSDYHFPEEILQVQPEM